MGELGSAREHYQKALALDPTNRIAERNIDRLKLLLVEAGDRTVAGRPGEQGPRRHLRRGDRQDRLRPPRRAGPARRRSPRSTRATPSSSSPRATTSSRSATGSGSGSSSRGSRPGCSSSSPNGNKYPAGVTSLGATGRPDHHPRDLPGPAQLREGELPDRGEVHRPPARTRRAPSSARTRTSRRTSRTTSRTRRSRTSTGCCPPTSPPTRRSRRSRTSSRSRSRPSPGSGAR